ncbi:hypothetical protein GCM10011378_21530 [Hymenobacter glacieicola]|uniref:DUF4350 domain-containing protein n=2 Tax=Hymenobacter glacieicola TaxID=1562124 RepID=A0ABQ1WW16_9BACT|nr:hypothetical protein GCM10011378_21530 [Hymenobacter glacieicola]
MGAGLLAVAGLWLAAYPPVRTQQHPATQAAILLTDSYSADTLRYLLRRLGPGTPVWRYAAAAPDTPTLGSVSALRQRLPQLRAVHVVGQGLPATDVPALHGLRVVSHSVPLTPAFHAAAWPRQPELGQPWTIEGYYQGQAGEPAWVSLVAAGTSRDSVQLPTGRGSFRLRFTPKTTGRAVYTLVARQDGRRRAQEPVPLEVRPTRPVRVLLLAAAPSFEVRFLKNYLASQQHAVALRTGLSRGLTQTEFLNFPTPPDLTRVTSSLLTRVEVVITDAASLAALSSSEAATLAQAVRSGACGMLLVADAPTLPRSLPGGTGPFQLQPRPAAATASPQLLAWPEAPARLATLLPATLRATTATRALITTPQQQPVAATRRVGLGQVVVTTATETFPWLLQGQQQAYGAYWSRLLTAVVPASPLASSIQLATSWPRVHTPVLVRVTGSSTPALRLRAAAQQAPVPVALRQDEHVPEWASAPYWPATSGWHEAQAGAARDWFYVFAPTHWRGLAQQEWQRQLALLPPPAPQQSIAAATVTTHTAWPRWWGYLLFLVCAGLLWVEEKL